MILAVGGLGFLGYLGMASSYMYGELGATPANVLVGILSSIVDNIPVMFAVLTMNPDMSHAQWLLVTLTAGVGEQFIISRFSSRYRIDGTGARSLHIHDPPKMDTCHCIRLCSKHLGSYSNQWVLTSD